jgi:hypothetical protein
MVPPLGEGLASDLLEDLFECSLCCNTVLEPSTLACCGSTYCRACLQKWVLKNVRQSGVPRCPQAGCAQRLPLRLPVKSVMLERTMEILIPEEVQQRREEAWKDAEEEEEEEVIPGGFVLYDDVAASRDLTIGEDRQIVVPFGASGVVVGRFNEERLTVKFDERMDGSEGCLNVKPFEVLKQLPLRFGVRLGQRVVATRDLMIGLQLAVRFGTRGVVLASYTGEAGEDRVTVQFDERADGGANSVNCLPCEIAPSRKLAGGFELAQSVSAAFDLISGDTVIVKAGTTGTIIKEYNDLRVSVLFSHREDGLRHMVNVTPAEIIPS